MPLIDWHAMAIGDADEDRYMLLKNGKLEWAGTLGAGITVTEYDGELVVREHPELSDTEADA